MKNEGGSTFFKVTFGVTNTLTFYERLMEFREKDESLPVFAKRIKKSVRALQYWRTGKTFPTIKEVERIASIFQVRPAWLAWGEGEKYDPR